MTFLRRRRSLPSLDIAPLVDVVFLLLIFFLLCSTFVMPALKLTLPQARNQQYPPPQELVVSVDRQGNFYVNQEPVPEDHLRDRLQTRLAALKEKRLTFRGDARSEYHNFVKVLDLAQELGVEDISLVHDREKVP
ncbi:MAG: biopolymer transporter ExbD [Deltaproteobacteria bacterium]|nr:biopolymer transporter ExbD [Deltaproteobacteria bacterium]MBW1952881.1 biopolymer transporter ExbD [Deltaproteobacteria bacterium]MBW1985879.1 biopolymer transporter ExbD [Deltaproteobacteria bacterium]MBW2133639.1 biopolymer transporter ExbD [Deltaproteobacteria bacterium]